MERQMIFLLIFSPRLLVKCAANMLKIGYEIFLCQEIILDREFAWAREIFQTLKFSGSGSG